MTGWLFCLPFVALFLLVFVAPILSSVWAAFHAMQSVAGGLFGGGEQEEVFVGVKNFVAAASNPAFWSGMGRVTLFGALQIPIMIGVALVLALVLDAGLVRRTGVWRLLYFLPFAIPGIIAAIVWTYLYVPEISPFAGSLPAIGSDPFFLSPSTILVSIGNIVTWEFVGYNMLIFLAALKAIPSDLYEAARLDGASGLQIALRIKIPMVRGAALLAVLLSIIGTVQLFNEPMVLRTVASWMGNDFTPMMLAYSSMMGQSSPSGAGPASAISILMAVIAGGLAALYAAIQRKVD